MLVQMRFRLTLAMQDSNAAILGEAPNNETFTAVT